MTNLLDFPGLRKRMTLEPRFGIEFLKMCERLKLVPDYILSVMSAESGIDPAAENRASPFFVFENGKKTDKIDGYATGLIQFIPGTARRLGTTTEALRGMSAVEQLQYVERFFEMSGKLIRPGVPGDYYMAVFLPVFVGDPSDKVLGRAGDSSVVPKTNLSYASIYNANKVFDKTKRGFFTVNDVWQSTLSRIASARTRPPIEVTAQGPLVSVAPPAPASPLLSLPPAWRFSGAHSDLPVLRIGAKGTAVSLAQVLLGCDVISGVYTEAMSNDYVRPFQVRAGLPNDAVVGPLTWERLALDLGP